MRANHGADLAAARHEYEGCGEEGPVLAQLRRRYPSPYAYLSSSLSPSPAGNLAPQPLARSFRVRSATAGGTARPVSAPSSTRPRPLSRGSALRSPSAKWDGTRSHFGDRNLNPAGHETIADSPERDFSFKRGKGSSREELEASLGPEFRQLAADGYEIQFIDDAQQPRTFAVIAPRFVLPFLKICLFRQRRIGAHSNVTLLIESCGETWHSQAKHVLARFNIALQQFKKRTASESDTSGISLLHYAGTSCREGRLGAFEVREEIQEKRISRHVP